ncbi:hypothetical protein TNCV_4529101 [Trichonephila clavipes]|uniref:Uncharacterized protein n=1 Tax=Trichonephila clavipes TaxID=2585209 RepID=A0A8X6S2L7_TRICX|nr:hypothetical protein TNCV_4529101 [Trichonephila clavipes]
MARTTRSRWSHRCSIGFKSGEFAGQGGRLTHPGALRTTHVHWQLYGTSHCPAGRSHHPEEEQCACRVDMVRKDRFVLVLIHRAFHNDK